MGSGISSLSRLRKAVLIRAYNLRAAEQTLIDQFMPFTYQKEGKGLYISIHQIKKCLKMDSAEYLWIEEVLQAIFTTPTTPPTQKPSEMFFFDFIQFLETGKAPNTVLEDHQRLQDGRRKSFNSVSEPAGSAGVAENEPRKEKDSSSRLKQFPPIPPSRREFTNDPLSPSEKGEREVIEINLSKVNLTSTLPQSVKLHDTDVRSSQTKSRDPEDTLEVIIRPVGGGKMPLGVSTQGKALWRKREVVKQERSVHYTTIDDEGGLQELVEKETTQTEVLHMECRETGEFAHRELTEFEQVETFNDEIVNAVRGNEEYVHLKSLEDEFHYMESNMPPKEKEEENRPPADGESHHPESSEPPQEKEEEIIGGKYEDDEKNEREHGHSSYDQYVNTERQEEKLFDDVDKEGKTDDLRPPDVQTPIQALSPDNKSPMISSRHRRSRDFFDENKDDDLGTVAEVQNNEADDFVLHEPGSFSRGSPFQTTTATEDPLNSTIRKNFSSTHSSYQSLHEID